WIAIIFWLALATYGTVIFLRSESPWQWRGGQPLPANYRLTASDSREIAGGSNRDRYQGRYLRRQVPADGYFGTKDLASAPEIAVRSEEVPVLIPLANQPAVASFINAGRVVAGWSGATCQFDKTKVSALLCPATDSQPMACQAVIALPVPTASRVVA